MHFIFTDNAIKEFMEFFRKNFPDASITPKLHLLEHHAVKFIRRWRGGFGMYGEQGAESIHQTFNKLFRVYGSMKPLSRRLNSVMKAHLTAVNPKAQSMKPRILKRKREE